MDQIMSCQVILHTIPCIYDIMLYLTGLLCVQMYIYIYTNSTGDSKVKGLAWHQGKRQRQIQSDLFIPGYVGGHVYNRSKDHLTITIPERSQSQNCQEVLFFVYSDMPLASKDFDFYIVKSLYMPNLWSSNSTPFNKTLPINPKYESPKMSHSISFLNIKPKIRKNTNLPMSTLIESSRELHPIWCLN